MDIMEFLKLGVYVLIGITGWFVRILWQEQKEMREAMKDHQLHVSEQYAKKQEVQSITLEIRSNLKEITAPLFAKLDRIETYLLENRDRK